VDIKSVLQVGSGDFEIVLTNNVTEIKVEDFSVQAPLHVQLDKPIFVTNYSDTPLNFVTIPKSDYNKIVVLSKNRRVTVNNGELSCDGQGLLPQSQSDCQSVGLVKHYCYSLNNKFFLDQTYTHLDYSCPCQDQVQTTCHLKIDKTTLQFNINFPVTQVFVDNTVTLLTVGKSFLLTTNLQQENSVTIRGTNNNVFVQTENIFSITSDYLNIISLPSRNITFLIPTAKSKTKTNTESVDVTMTEDTSNYCTSLFINQTTKCLICGERTAQDGMCEARPTVEKCELYDQKGFCVTCEIGYFLKVTVAERMCVPCSVNCERCDETKCVLCANGYKVSQLGKCESVINCEFYTLGMCKKCLFGDKTTDYQICDTKCDTSCYECYSLKSEGIVNERCDVCNIDNQYMKKDSSCILSQWSDIVSNNHVVQCTEGTQFVNEKCEMCPSRCSKCADSNCMECKDITDVLIDGVCYEQTTTLCQIITDGICKKCDTNHFFNYKTQRCESIDESCQVALYDGKCLKCVNKFDYVSSDGKKCLSKQSDMTCEYAEYGVCKRCINGYYLDETKCAPCIEKCILCSNKSNCEQCISNYIFNTTSLSCETFSIPHCLIYKGYACDKCENGYYKTNGKCSICENNCEYCTSKEKCILCSSDYYLHEDSCYHSTDNKIQNCTSFSPTGCLKCSLGSYLSDNICLPCDSFSSNCIECDSSTHMCLTCTNTYILINGTCTYYEKIKHCIRERDNKCDECSFSYVLGKDKVSCTFQIVGWVVSLCIIFFFILLAILIFLIFMVFVAFSNHNEKVKQMRTNGIFPLKYCDVQLTPYPTTPSLLTSTTLLEYQDKLQIHREYIVDFYIGNKDQETVTITFLVTKDTRYNVSFDPEVLVLKSNKCCQVKVLLMPLCTFSSQIPLTFPVSINNKSVTPLEFKVAVTSAESLSLDPTLLDFNETLKTNFTEDVCIGRFNNKSVKVRNIGFFDYKQSEEKRSYEDPLVILEAFPNNPFLVKYFGMVTMKSARYLVTEYVPLGTMQNAIDAKANYPFKLKARICQDITTALSILHTHNFLHLNIKPSNILLLGEDLSDPQNIPVAKLADAGYKYHINKFFNKKIEVVEDPTYLAPEILNGQKLTQKTDIYSLGMAMYATLAMANPFSPMEFKHSWTIEKFICVGRRPPCLIGMDPTLFDIIANCWEHCSADRPVVNEVLQNIRGITSHFIQ
ncbi:serine-threonine protein kinase, partial [Entamoeba invadens IP1]